VDEDPILVRGFPIWVSGIGALFYERVIWICLELATTTAGVDTD